MNDKLKAVLDEVHFAPKPKKKDALELLKRAIQGEEMPPQEWAQLMRYFTPTPPKTPRTLRDWLAAAVGPKSPRQDCHVVHRLPGGMLVATDGFRLHVASADHPDAASLPPGDVLSPVSWQAIPANAVNKLPERFEERILRRIEIADPPVDLPPVKDWPKTSDPVARFIPGTDVAVRVAHAQAACPVWYLGTASSTEDAGIPGSALFATPWGHAIIMPYRIS